MEQLKIAIPVFKNRISPLFDVARSFYFAAVEDISVKNSCYSELWEEFPQKKIISLRKMGVNIIICSAVSKFCSRLIISNGIDLIPGVIGSVEEVINAFLGNHLEAERYCMPGCPHRDRYKGVCGDDSCFKYRK